MSKKGTIKVGLGTIGGALCLWVFAYISTLFPYLGWGRVQNNTEFATSMDFATFNLGMPYMLLFEGQTAFYEYDSHSAESQITFDVKPVLSIGYSEQMQRVSGDGAGRIEIPIRRTGLYRFKHEAATARGHVYTHYDAVWGAL